MTDSTLFQANASLNSMQPLIMEDGNGSIPAQQPGISPPPKRSISNKTHLSKTDPDATLAIKSGTLRTLKYKAHLCCDSKSRIILALKITTGAVHDSQPYLELLDYLKSKLHLTIDEVIADRAYGSGNIISILQDKGIRHFIPLFSTRSGSSANSITEGFKDDAEKKIYTCPAQYELKPGKISPNDYVIHHSSVINCRNCSIKANCAAPKKKNSEIRVISRHIHFDLFKEVTKRMETSEFKKRLTERLWKIEGIMNELKNYHGLFKAKYRGLNNVQIQAYMAAMAINIKRMVFLLIILYRYYHFLRQFLNRFYNRPYSSY